MCVFVVCVYMYMCVCVFVCGVCVCTCTHVRVCVCVCVYSHPFFMCVMRADDIKVVTKKAMMMNRASDHSSLNQLPLWGMFTMCTGLSREP